jgi:hypothetical protein
MLVCLALTLLLLLTFKVVTLAVILEFFLLPICVDSQEQKMVLNSLSITMQHVRVKACALFLKATQGCSE